MTRYQVLNGGEPGGAFSIKSTNGMTYPIEITANINTIQSPQRSVHFGVGNASSSGSPIGNSVSPLVALNMREKAMYTIKTTPIINNVPTIASNIIYGSQLNALAWSPYVVYEVLRGEPNNPTVCIAPDMNNIPTVQIIV